MAESIVQVTEGSGKKLHTNSYTVGANTVEDEFTVPGPYPYATYINQIGGASGATANDHLLCLNAGASLKVRVHRIKIVQSGNGATASIFAFQILRTTTGAPTGGTAVTPAPYDTTDTAGAAGRSIPAVKGTESTVIMEPRILMRQALSATAGNPADVWEWRAATAQGGTGKPIIIPSGTTNGLVVKNITNSAGVTWNIEMEFTETAF